MRFLTPIVCVVVGLSVLAANCGKLSMAQSQPEHLVPSLSFLVAPFQNSSADARAQDYLAADVTDNLVADLSRLAGSFVIAAASAAALTQNSTEIGELRKQTGVHFLIRGDAGVHGTIIRVAATMLDLENGKKVWDGQFERPFVELRALERDLVVQIADHLGVASPEKLRSAGRAEPQNAVALEALLRAKVLLNMPQTASTISKAQQLLEDALLADPASSGAMVGLASIHLVIALASRSKATAMNEWAQCEQLLQQALAHDPHHVGALSTLGALRRATGKRRDALAAYEAAADINPSDANVQAQIGRLQIDLGQPTQALEGIEQALRLSPLDPQRTLWYMFAGLARLYAKQPDAARSWLEQSVAISPRFVTALVFLAVAQELSAHDADARHTIEVALRINPALSIRRVAQQFVPDEPVAHREWLEIADSLRRIGLPN